MFHNMKEDMNIIQGNKKVERLNDRTEIFDQTRPAIETHMKILCFNKAFNPPAFYCLKLQFQRSQLIILAVKNDDKSCNKILKLSWLQVLQIASIALFAIDMKWS